MDKPQTDQDLITSPSVLESEQHNNLDSKKENIGGEEHSSLGNDSSANEIDNKSITAAVEKESCTCQCSCQERLEKLENEMKDLMSWKVGRQKLDDIIEDWKKDIDTWMQTSFGFSFSGSLPKPNDDTDMIGSVENNVTSDSKRTITEEDKDEAKIVLDGGDTENVEITPDLFGHFLLDNEYDYEESDGHDLEKVDEYLEEEEESEVPVGKSTKRIRKHKNDTDSECYTLSSSSSSEDITTSEDEYEPQRKRGRGRGRGKFPVNQSLKTKNLTSTSNANNNTSSSANSMVDLGSAESRKELLKHCRKRQGNIWECTVCGFMLTSFENMLLHIKYNHSSSTHTCPYCRIVVLCRSPKDAVVHQSQCKMRPANTNDKTLDTNKINPTQTKKVSVVTSNVPDKPKPNNHKNVHQEVDKFVDDILGPGPTGASTSTKNKVISTNNIKKTEAPTVVTLSSDDEDSVTSVSTDSDSD